VCGKLKPLLRNAQYNVVQALLAAGADGLSKNDLESRSRHSDAVNILKRLAGSDPDWNKVIKLAGSPGRRYRIV
jgi:hypothetical protein